MREVKVNMDYTEADIINFNKDFFFMNIPKLALYLILSIYFLIVFFYAILENNATEYMTIFKLVAIPVGIVFLFVMIFKISAKRSLKTNKLLQKTQNYIIREEGLAFSNEDMQGNIKWSDFHNTIETKSAFSFFISMQQAYIIPKRYINAEDIQFIREVSKNIPIPKSKKKRKIVKYMLLGHIILFLLVLLVIIAYDKFY